MKILHFILQNNSEAVEQNITSLMHGQIHLGHTVVLLTDTMKSEENIQRINFFYSALTVFKYFHSVRKLRQLIQQENIEIIHAHSETASRIAFFATRFLTVPLVSSIDHFTPGTFFGKHFRFYGEKIFPQCRTLMLNINRNGNIPLSKMKIIPPIISAKKEDVAVKSGGQFLRIGITGDERFLKSPIASQLLNSILPKVQEKNNHVVFHLLNQSEDVRRYDVLIGHGRKILQALANGKTVIGMGCANYLGRIQESNEHEAFDTNFGEFGKIREFDNAKILADIMAALQKPTQRQQLWQCDFIKKYFNTAAVTSSVLEAYIEAYSQKIGIREIPVLRYNWFNKTESVSEEHLQKTLLMELENQLQFLKKKNYSILNFYDIKDILEFKKELPARPIMLTFELGFKMFYQIVFPLLKKFSSKGILFLSASPFENIERENLSTVKEVQEVTDAGIEIGSYAVHGKRLSVCTDDEMKEEIQKSKIILEQLFERQCLTFAYPLGMLNEKIKNEVREAGYIFAVSEDSGSRNFWLDRLKIRRITIEPHTSKFEFWAKTSGYYYWYTHVY